MLDAQDMPSRNVATPNKITNRSIRNGSFADNPFRRSEGAKIIKSSWQIDTESQLQELYFANIGQDYDLGLLRAGLLEAWREIFKLRKEIKQLTHPTNSQNTS